MLLFLLQEPHVDNMLPLLYIKTSFVLMHPPAPTLSIHARRH
jgi:hypothetical protein